jgi:hypothetical protein
VVVLKQTSKQRNEGHFMMTTTSGYQKDILLNICVSFFFPVEDKALFIDRILRNVYIVWKEFFLLWRNATAFYLWKGKW